VSPKAAQPLIHVVAGVVTEPLGKMLIAQRPPGKPLAGGWEFPGGKLEAGEDRRAGLRRELREELGIEISAARPLMRVRHSYAHGEVLLDVFVVNRYQGCPAGLDGQALRWCTHAQLADAGLLPADRPIIEVLRLPERLTLRETPEYTVMNSLDAAAGEGASAAARDGRLRGVFFAPVPPGAQDAAAAAATATAAVKAATAVAEHADFLVLRGGFSAAAIGALCAAVAIPVYVPDLALEEAWALGASGVSGI